MEKQSAMLDPMDMSNMSMISSNAIQVLPSSPAPPPPPPPPPAYQPMLLGPSNTLTTCQFCLAKIKTSVSYTSTTRTHLLCFMWHFVCCLCCIPYCCASAKNSDHYCPNCNRYLGTYKK